MAKATRTTPTPRGAGTRQAAAKAVRSVHPTKAAAKPKAKTPAKAAKAPAKKAAAASTKKVVAPAKKLTVAAKAAQRSAQGGKTAAKPAAKPAAKVAKAPAKSAKKAVKSKAPAPTKVVAKAAAKTAKATGATKAVKATQTKPATKAVKAVKGPPALVPKPAPSRPVLSEVVARKHRSPAVAASTMDRLRVQLIEEREQHLRQAEGLLAEAEALANEREPGDTQFDEESGEGDTLSVERERDLALSASARQTVEDITKALARMEDGTYGYCEVCGDRIPVPRLEAIPWADQCVKCKSRGERRR